MMYNCGLTSGMILVGNGASKDDQVSCIICGLSQSMDKVTVGSVYTDGTQAFACSMHIPYKRQWVVSWTKFEYAQLPRTLSHDQRRPFNKYLESRSVKSPNHLMSDVAQHLLQRYSTGEVLIVVDRPTIFLSVLRKHWIKYLRLLQRERASTLDTLLIKELNYKISGMEELRFVSLPPYKQLKANICLTDPSELSTISSNFTTIYLCSTNTPQCNEVARSMTAGGLIVTYSY